MRLKTSDGPVPALKKAALTAAGAVRPFAARLILCGLGCFGGIYGAAAGLLIGFMVDDALALRYLRAFYREAPDRPPAGEAEPGIAAAAGIVCIRMRAAGEAAEHDAEELFVRLAERNGLSLRARRLIPKLFAAAADEVADTGLPVFSRLLAQYGSPRVKSLLADFLYGEELLAGRKLARDREDELRRLFADSGIGPAEAARARGAAFPDYRDAWTVLGIERGADRETIKRAFRRLSRELHPDAQAARRAAAQQAAQDGAAVPEAEDAGQFEELREAYESLIKKAEE